MTIRRLGAAVLSGVLAATVVAAAPTSAAAPSAAASRGDTSLATVLAADGNRFDRNSRDFDVLHRAVLRVLKAKPNSTVGVLTDGDVRLTAFAPTDGAFRRLVRDLTGTMRTSEKVVFKALVRVAGVRTLEAVLLYHVVPGAPITAREAARADGARLETALDGLTVRVNVREHGTIALVDKDRNDRNATVAPRLADINKGNKQIAHGITRVLRPVNL